MCPVFQDLESLFQVGWLISRDRQDINSFIKTCVSIQVVSKLNTNTLQVGYDIILFKVFCTVSLFLR
jgi:hypothetical protein